MGKRRVVLCGLAIGVMAVGATTWAVLSPSGATPPAGKPGYPGSTGSDGVHRRVQEDQMTKSAEPRLDEGTWAIVSAAGIAEPLESRHRLTFASGQVRFEAPCNVYVTGISLAGNELSFEPFRDMPKVCGPDAMGLESALLRSLERVTGFEIEPGGDLVLASLGREILRARR